MGRGGGILLGYLGSDFVSVGAWVGDLDVGGVLAWLVRGWLVGVSVVRFVITLFAEGSLSSPEMEYCDINCFLSLFLNFFCPFL